MKHWMKDEDALDMQESALTLDTVDGKKQTHQEHSHEITQADILLIPTEPFRGRCICFFPDCTKEFQYHLAERTCDELAVHICAKDKTVQRMEWHADFMMVVSMVVGWDTFSAATSKVAVYLDEKAEQCIQSVNNKNIRVNVWVEKNKKFKEMAYIGTVKNFERAMKMVDESIFETEYEGNLRMP